MPFGQARFAENNQLLNERFSQKGTLICGHRGNWHGNILQNTTGSFKAAIAMGADIVEMDTTATADGVVYSLHDGVEPLLFGIQRNLAKVDSDEVNRLEPLNTLGVPCKKHVQTLSEICEWLPHDQLINIDRSWRAAGLVPGILDQYPHMAKTALIKAPLDCRNVLEQLNEHAVKYMFMPICYSLADVEAALSYPDLNVVGAELIAHTQEDELFSDDAIAWIHSKGLFTFVNALVITDYYVRDALYGGLDDDISVLEDPALGWGKLMDKQINVIQTDWPAILDKYRATR